MADADVDPHQGGSALAVVAVGKTTGSIPNDCARARFTQEHDPRVQKIYDFGHPGCSSENTKSDDHTCACQATSIRRFTLRKMRWTQCNCRMGEASNPGPTVMSAREIALCNAAQIANGNTDELTADCGMQTCAITVSIERWLQKASAGHGGCGH